MGQRRFEQEFGRKLQDRRIAPSAGSWEKLEAQLETAGEKKRFPFKWIGIAASLAGGLLIGSMVYNQNGNQETQQLVESPTQEIKINSDQASGKNEVAFETVMPIKNKGAIEENTEVKIREDLNSNNRNLAVVSAEKKTKKEVSNERELPPVNDAEIDGMLEKAMAAISSEKGEDGNATDAEVEELLQMAVADIGTDDTPTKRYADSGSILMEVEMELEKTYREKVFEILKESYSKTRTAVANRGF